jgi:hypothetical protein
MIHGEETRVQALFQYVTDSLPAPAGAWTILSESAACDYKSACSLSRRDER